jgi:NADPH:quinone reductase-like Zn-dependent oxidoreductase
MYLEYGAPEVVHITEIDKPEARENELLVKIEATTVNRTDCGYRAAKPFILRVFTGLEKPRPNRRVLGTEFAGTVEAVGGGVNSFEVGERVFGYVEGPFGAHAEYLTTSGGPTSEEPRRQGDRGLQHRTCGVGAGRGYRNRPKSDTC